MQRPGVVYQVHCASCQEVHIGQTGHTLEHCLKKHKKVLTSGTTISSAVAEHALNTNHMTLTGQMLQLLTVTHAFIQDVPWKLGTSGHWNTPWTESKNSYPQPITPSYTQHHFSVLEILFSPHFLFSARMNGHLNSSTCLYHWWWSLHSDQNVWWSILSLEMYRLVYSPQKSAPIINL